MDLQRRRYGNRKNRKVNLILNISIAIVLFLIGFLVYQLFFKSDDLAVVEDQEIEETEMDEVEEMDELESDEEMDETIDEVDEEEVVEVEEERDEPVERTPATEQEDNESTNVDREPTQVQNNGQWEPIGTVQQEPFVAVYEKDHVNWQEMTKALQVATGLGDDMVIWWIGNGGDHQSAVGVVSNYNNQNTPYEVRIEWVTNRGWKPVSVNQLSENRYLPNSDEQ